MPEAWRMHSSRSPELSRLWLIAALGIGSFGLIIRAAAVAFAPEGTSSRDTHQLRAPSLNTTGMYSVVRNPLYLGNALMWLGAVASLGLWWLVALTAALYWLYIERVILVEESFLETEFGRAFNEWADRTPAFVPNLSCWRPASSTLSWRRVSAEHNGLLGFLLAVSLFSLGVEVIVGRRAWSDWQADHWMMVAALATALTLSVVLVIAKRVTR